MIADWFVLSFVVFLIGNLMMLGDKIMFHFGWLMDIGTVVDLVGLTGSIFCMSLLFVNDMLN